MRWPSAFIQSAERGGTRLSRPRAASCGVVHAGGVVPLQIEVCNPAAERGDAIVEQSVAMDVRAIEQHLGRLAPGLVPVRAHFGEIAAADAARGDDHVLGARGKAAPLCMFAR